MEYVKTSWVFKMLFCCHTHIHTQTNIYVVLCVYLLIYNRYSICVNINNHVDVYENTFPLLRV